MREESRGEENREQKGLKQHEQESSLTRLTVICRPHIHTHTQTHSHAHRNSVTHVQSAPHTYTFNVYRKNLPLYPSDKHTQRQRQVHTHTLCTQLCATLTVICHLLPLNRHEGAQLTLIHTCKGHTMQTLSHVQIPPTFCLSLSRKILYEGEGERERECER